ncbi:hypothetical protein [Paraburkholderia caledonica]|uniref:hypothetical protein n=1 Tax=Paraburkholderia caledonica TaxID=134536 RepID=UPI00211ADF16|nr:hypothetical protein [Paraburkholderia caledonica]
MTSSRYPVDALRGRLSNVQPHFPTTYVATLRKLHNWVFGGMDGTPAARDMRSIMETGSLLVKGRSARQIALALLRACFERCPSTAFGWLNPRQAKVGSYLYVHCKGRWLPRLPLRAILLGSYAILLQDVLKQMQENDRVSLLGRGTGIQSAVPLVHLPEYVPTIGSLDLCEGFVVFPTIQELDLKSVWPADIW